jgi:hypothetical protein
MRRNWTPDEDGQLQEMLRLNCHRAVIAVVLSRTDMEIRERVGLLKALRKSDSPFDHAIGPA